MESGLITQQSVQNDESSYRGFSERLATAASSSLVTSSLSSPTFVWCLSLLHHHDVFFGLRPSSCIPMHFIGSQYKVCTFVAFRPPPNNHLICIISTCRNSCRNYCISMHHYSILLTESCVGTLCRNYTIHFTESSCVRTIDSPRRIILCPIYGSSQKDWSTYLAYGLIIRLSVSQSDIAALRCIYANLGPLGLPCLVSFKRSDSLHPSSRYGIFAAGLCILFL